MNNPFDQINSKLDALEQILNELKTGQFSHSPITMPDPEPYIYGITGLAKFLKVSLPTAQKIKGKVPFSQSMRTIIFEKEKVLSSLANYNHKKK
jgi:hypothetical protein